MHQRFNRARIASTWIRPIPMRPISIGFGGASIHLGDPVSPETVGWKPSFGALEKAQATNSTTCSSDSDESWTILIGSEEHQVAGPPHHAPAFRKEAAILFK